jgi:hypothetical protein
MLFIMLCNCFIQGDLMAGDTKLTDLLSGIDNLGEELLNGGIEMYVGSELTEYINGGAALFYSYNFKRLVVKKYVGDKDYSLIIEIYEFDTSENAFGIYSFDTDGEHPQIGHEATYAHGLLKFWKDRFFVRIFASYENTANKSDVLAFGEQIALNIVQLGTKPELLSRIPANNVLEGSVHYFHEDICLNNIYYITGENPLNLNSDTEAVTYEYEIEREILRIVLIRYLKPEHAQVAYSNFVAVYRSQPSVDSLVSYNGIQIIKDDENGKYVCARLVDNYFIVVFDAISEDACSRILHVQEALL